MSDVGVEYFGFKTYGLDSILKSSLLFFGNFVSGLTEFLSRNFQVKEKPVSVRTSSGIGELPIFEMLSLFS